MPRMSKTYVIPVFLWNPQRLLYIIQIALSLLHNFVHLGRGDHELAAGSAQGPFIPVLLQNVLRDQPRHSIHEMGQMELYVFRVQIPVHWRVVTSASFLMFRQTLFRPTVEAHQLLRVPLQLLLLSCFFRYDFCCCFCCRLIAGIFLHRI